MNKHTSLEIEAFMEIAIEEHMDQYLDLYYRDTETEEDIADEWVEMVEDIRNSLPFETGADFDVNEFMAWFGEPDHAGHAAKVEAKAVAV